MRLSDVMLGGLLLLFAAALALYSQTFPSIPGQEYGAAVFPTLVAFGLGGCGIVLMARGVRAGSTFPLIVRSDWSRDPRAGLAVFITLLMVVGYILFAKTIGFLPVMGILLLVLFLLLGVRWFIAIALAIVATLVIDYVFGRILLVPLPLGMMPRIPY